MNTFDSRVFQIAAILLSVFSGMVFADTSRHKEILVGDRAATMGGAYAAISDDTSGAYYNPAGLIYGAGSAMTGITNAYGIWVNYYEDAITDGEGENKESAQYHPDFMGYMKKVGDDSVLGFSAAVDDFSNVRQDNRVRYDNNTKQTIINRRGQDRHFRYGPSFAKKLGDSFSAGLTAYYFQREYNLQENREDGTPDINTLKFKNTVGTELGWNIRAGLMWSPMEKLSIGFVAGKTMIHYSEKNLQVTEKTAGSSSVTFTSAKDDTIRRTPFETTLGVAYFPSPFLLIAADVSYYMLNDDDKVNVFNYSVGFEYFLSEKHAIRGGFFTNYDDDVEPSASSTNREKIDMLGVTGGYSVYAGPTMITLGVVWQQGNGKAQVIDGSSAIQDVNREHATYILAVGYSVD